MKANMDKINRSRTIQHLPAPHVYKYRLALHESINDKMARFKRREDQCPVVIPADEIKSVMDLINDWQDELRLKNWSLCDKEGYRRLDVYFKNKSNLHAR